MTFASSPASSAPASDATSQPVIWAAFLALTEPDQWAMTFRRVGKTPTLFLRPIAECTKVR